MRSLIKSLIVLVVFASFSLVLPAQASATYDEDKAAVMQLISDDSPEAYDTLLEMVRDEAWRVLDGGLSGKHKGIFRVLQSTGSEVDGVESESPKTVGLSIPIVPV